MSTSIFNLIILALTCIIKISKGNMSKIADVKESIYKDTVRPIWLKDNDSKCQIHDGIYLRGHTIV
jgi:hypothetical protein